MKSFNEIPVTPEMKLRGCIMETVRRVWNRMIHGKINTVAEVNRHLIKLGLPLAAIKLVKANPELQALYWLLDR